MNRWLTSYLDVLLIVLVAFVIRISMVALLHQQGYTGDEREHVSLGAKLAEGKPFLDSNNEWSTKAPLYPFVLSVVMRFFGNGLFIPHLLNCLLGSLLVFLGFKLSMALLEVRFVALLTAALLAVNPSLNVTWASFISAALFVYGVAVSFRKIII